MFALLVANWAKGKRRRFPLDSVAPFIHSGKSIRRQMVDVSLALLPAVVGGIWYHQTRGALILGLALASCLLAGCVLKPRQPTWDNVVTGLILGLLLPPNLPPWAAVMAGFVAVLAMKGLFGGLGKNWCNPACGGALIALLLVPLTPLRMVEGTLVSGYVKGSLGETSSFLLVVGGIYLALRQLVAWRVLWPYFVFSFLTAASLPGCNPMAVLAWGGTWLCGLFLVADPVTSPMGKSARTLYGAGCGLLTTYFAYHISAMGGLCLGVIIMNLVGRLLDKVSLKTGT